MKRFGCLAVSSPKNTPNATKTRTSRILKIKSIVIFLFEPNIIDPWQFVMFHQTLKVPNRHNVEPHCNSASTCWCILFPLACTSNKLIECQLKESRNGETMNRVRKLTISQIQENNCVHGHTSPEMFCGRPAFQHYSTITTAVTITCSFSMLQLIWIISLWYLIA